MYIEWKEPTLCHPNWEWRKAGFCEKWEHLNVLSASRTKGAALTLMHLYKNRAIVTRLDCRLLKYHSQRHTRILLHALTHMCVIKAIQCAHIYITYFEQCYWYHQIWARQWWKDRRGREREQKKVQPYIMPLIEWMAKKCQIFNIHALKSLCCSCACVPL